MTKPAESELPKPKLVQPLGDRSCRTGGTWETCDGASIASEQDAIAMVSRSRDDARLMRREIRTSMQLAAQGRLTYGMDLDVYCSNIADLVLELRLHSRVQYPDGARAVRLYFSEPDTQADLLLAARLAAKPASAAGLALQDEHMLEAQDRVKRHLGV